MSEQQQAVERKIYRPGAEPPERRFEWVELERGWVCLWDLRLAESVRITDQCTLPEKLGGGESRGRAVALQILYSCYDGEPSKPGVSRIWKDHELGDVYLLSFVDMRRLGEAIQRLNGQTATEAEIVRDFTPATGAPVTSE